MEEKGIKNKEVPSLSVGASKMATIEFYIIYDIVGGRRQRPQTIWSILLAPVATGLYFTYCVKGLA
jgi:hypothetical protein